MSRRWFNLPHLLRPHQWFSPSTVALAANGIAVRRPDHSIQQLSSSEATYASSEALLEALAKVSHFIAQGSVRFIVSHHFVRYLVLPWQEGVVQRSDWEAIAQHEFRKRFGAVAEDWRIRVSLHGYQQSVMACAIDQRLVDGLQNLALEHKWRISAIEPLLMSILDQHHGYARWLMVAEPERILLCEHHEGSWQSFSMLSPPLGEENTQAQQQIRRSMQQSTTDSNTVIQAWVSPELNRQWASDTAQVRVAPTPYGQANTAAWMAGF